MHWQDVFSHAKTGIGRTLSFIAAVLLLWGLAKLYEWIAERTIDPRVEDYLRNSVGPEYRPMHSGFVRDPIPRSITEISNGSRVAEWFVKGSLNRLKRSGRVVRNGDKWEISR